MNALAYAVSGNPSATLADVTDVAAHQQTESHHYVVHFPPHPARTSDPHYADFNAYHQQTRASARCYVGQRVGYGDCLELPVAVRVPPQGRGRRSYRVAQRLGSRPVRARPHHERLTREPRIPMTRYHILVADELIRQPDLMLPDGFRFVEASASADGHSRWWLVEDDNAPAELEQHRVEVVFTRIGSDPPVITERHIVNQQGIRIKEQP